MILSGTELSKKLKEELKNEIDLLKSRNERLPKLSVIIVGNNPASQSYVKSKEKTANELGFLSNTFRLDETITQKEVLDLINVLNNDSSVDGILVQLPLPYHLSEFDIIEAIDFKKDVDGFTTKNTGLLSVGKECSVSCTPKGIMSLLESGDFDFNGKNVCIIGRSNIVGKPIASLLLNKNCTVTICHSKTKNIRHYSTAADLVIVAIGKPEFIDSSYIKEGAVVVDVGINRTENGLVGDCNFDSIFQKASLITPVPGGVGPMTIVSLFQNTMELYKKHK